MHIGYISKYYYFIGGVDHMKDLTGTKTLENLMKAFAGESQARNRYTNYASAEKSNKLNLDPPCVSCFKKERMSHG
jgi:hypothetical protein